MITAPKTLPAGASLADAREAFEDSHVHMVLLATLTDRTIGPDELIEPVHRRVVSSGQRRLAVVDATGRLLGLLCLKRDQAGFCSDEGVAARALDSNRAVRR